MADKPLLLDPGGSASFPDHVCPDSNKECSSANVHSETQIAGNDLALQPNEGQQTDINHDESISYTDLNDHNHSPAQQPQASGALDRPVLPPLASPYSLQAGDYLQQAYHPLSPFATTTQIPPEVQHQSTPTGRRNSTPVFVNPHLPTSRRHVSYIQRIVPGTPMRNEFLTQLLKDLPPRIQPLHKVQDNTPKRPIASDEGVEPAALIGLAHENKTRPSLPPIVRKSALETASGLEYVSKRRSLPPNFTSSSTPPPTLTDIPQGRLIVQLANPNAVIRQSASDVFDQDQRDKILWLALHGIQSQVIAHVLAIGSSAILRPAGPMGKQVFTAKLGKVVEHFIPELARGHPDKEDPDVMIQYLLDRDDKLNWSPFLLKCAVHYITDQDGNDDSARQARVKNARERKAAARWKADSAAEAEGVVPSHRRRRRQSGAALGGRMREAMELETIEDDFGYVEGNHEIEKALMKLWLVNIRELGKHPECLDQDEHAWFQQFQQQRLEELDKAEDSSPAVAPSE